MRHICMGMWVMNVTHILQRFQNLDSRYVALYEWSFRKKEMATTNDNRFQVSGIINDNHLARNSGSVKNGVSCPKCLQNYCKFTLNLISGFLYSHKKKKKMNF